MRKQSFTLLEFLIVIVVIAILIVKASFTLSNTSLNQVADQIISHINYTRHLALIDNKFQYYPINNSAMELNRTKYWFKQWWQIRFAKTQKTGEIFYEVFSDLPYTAKNGTYNFSKNGYQPTNKDSWNETYAKNPLNNLLLVGRKDDGSGNYPKNADMKLNLTKNYNIQAIEVNGNKVTWNKSKRFIFDNYGNVYTDEGKKGDGGDINPYDKDERIPLISTAKISLCQDNDCSDENKKITICITPKVGFAYICK
jgi:type II secretory pathway pseudopilin PulG